MTCHEAREWLSALIDDEIEPPLRTGVEAHVRTCAECGLELERLRATVGLMRRVEPVRAPAGFVDRVTARAFPAPWYRRAGAWLFLPLRVKLPVQAAAIVVLAGLAMLIVNRTPELRIAARVEPQTAPPLATAPPPVPSAAPPVSETSPPVPSAPPPVAQAPSPTPAAPAPSVTRDAPAETAAPLSPASRSDKGLVAPRRKAASATGGSLDERSREATGERIASAPLPAGALKPGPPPSARDAQSSVTPPSGATPSAVTAQPPRPLPVPPGPRAMTAPPPPAPIVAQPRPPAAEESPEARRERSLDRTGAAPSVSRAAGVAGSADVAGRLAVRDRIVAAAALSSLLARVGGAEITRREDGADIVVDVLIAEARYDDFVRGLETLGAWSAPGLRQRVMLDSPHVHLPIRIAQ